MIELKISPDNPGQLEILTALFTELPIEGIRELEKSFLVYTTAEHYNSSGFQERVESIGSIAPFKLTKTDLPDINWNKAWEEHFDPVIIEDFLTIRAGFHNLVPRTRQVITINPKMSFGTGHHATTWMMVKSLSMLNVRGKVLDAGTGTGILTILAHQLGAERLVAFDNDEWSYRNALENFSLNGMEGQVELIEGSIEAVDESNFDMILANINRNYLVAHTSEIAQKLAPGGFLIISGFYDVDSKQLLEPFDKLHLVAQYLLRKENWACIILNKTPLYDSL